MTDPLTADELAAIERLCQARPLLPLDAAAADTVLATVYRLLAEVKRLTAENAAYFQERVSELEAALRPFAAYADKVAQMKEAHGPHSDSVLLAVHPHISAYDWPGHLRVKDLQRAAATLRRDA